MNDILKISLASARKNAKMTQEQVCEKMHISKKTLVNWEKGAGEPKITIALQLAELYGLNINNIQF